MLKNWQTSVWVKVSSVYRTRTFRGDPATKRIFIAPQPPSTRWGRTALSQYRYLLFENEGEFKTFTLRIRGLQEKAALPQLNPKDIFDLIDDHSTPDKELEVPSTFRKLDWTHVPARSKRRNSRKITARILGDLQVHTPKSTTISMNLPLEQPDRERAARLERRRLLYSNMEGEPDFRNSEFESNRKMLNIDLFGTDLGIGTGYLPFLRRLGTPKAFSMQILQVFTTDLLVQAGAKPPIGYQRDFRQFRRRIRELLRQDQLQFRTSWMTLALLHDPDKRKLYLFTDWPEPAVLLQRRSNGDFEGKYYPAPQGVIHSFEEPFGVPSVQLKQNEIIFSHQGNVYRLRQRSKGFAVRKVPIDPSALPPPREPFSPTAFYQHRDFIEERSLEVQAEVSFADGTFSIMFHENGDPIWTADSLTGDHAVSLLWSGHLILKEMGLHLYWSPRETQLWREANILAPWLFGSQASLISLSTIPSWVNVVEVSVAKLPEGIIARWQIDDDEDAEEFTDCEQLAEFLLYPYSLGSQFTLFHPIHFLPEPDTAKGRFWLQKGNIEHIRQWLPENLRAHPPLLETPKYLLLPSEAKDPLYIHIDIHEMTAERRSIPRRKDRPITATDPLAMIEAIDAFLEDELVQKAENFPEVHDDLEEHKELLREMHRNSRFKGGNFHLDAVGESLRLVFSYSWFREEHQIEYWTAEPQEACEKILEAIEHYPTYIIDQRRHIASTEKRQFDEEITLSASLTELLELIDIAMAYLEEYGPVISIFERLLDLTLDMTRGIFSSQHLRKMQVPLGDLSTIAETLLAMLEGNLGQEWWNYFLHRTWKDDLGREYDVFFLLDLIGMLKRKEILELAKSYHILSFKLRNQFISNLPSEKFHKVINRSIAISFAQLAIIKAENKEYGKACKYQNLALRIDGISIVTKILCLLNLANYSHSLKKHSECNHNLKKAHELIFKLPQSIKLRIARQVHQEINILTTENILGFSRLTICTCTQKTGQNQGDSQRNG